MLVSAPAALNPEMIHERIRCCRSHGPLSHFRYDLNSSQHYPKGCPQLGNWLAVPRLVASFGCAAACRAGLVLKIDVGERLSRCRPGR
jgi:hypothetical protein